MGLVPLFYGVIYPVGLYTKPAPKQARVRPRRRRLAVSRKLPSPDTSPAPIFRGWNMLLSAAKDLSRNTIPVAAGATWVRAALFSLLTRPQKSVEKT